MPTHHAAKAAAVLIAASAVALPAIDTHQTADHAKAFVEVLAGPDHQTQSTLLIDCWPGTNSGCHDS